MKANFQHCAALVREHDRDRYLAALFAPAQHRDALFALHAFNAEIARVREVAREPMPGEIRLQWWREALAGERDGEAAAHPVAAALRETLGRYGFSAAPLLELIDARTFDLYDEPMANAGRIELYAIRTQSPVFAMAAGILSGGRALPEMFSLDAAVAYTIAGILRDFGRHAARGQLYVPLDVLEGQGVKPEEIFAGKSSDALHAALADMRAMAQRHLALAGEKLKGVDAGILPAFLPLALIGPQLRRMERTGYDPYRFESLPAWRRQWLLWRAARDPRRIFTV